MLKRPLSPSFKRGTSIVKRMAISRTSRDADTVRRPVRPEPYRKRPAEAEMTVRKVLRKPEPANVVKASNQVAKVPEASARTEEKPDEPNTEPAMDGFYELSPLLNKMLDAELQEIMKKVWGLQQIHPKDDAEKIVVNRFRNKVGETLRNTIGLNVTKRLLNIHNPLYVKMVFTDKPLRKDLLAFLKRYNICAFKRVGERGGIFAAKMRTYRDFDDLCTHPNLKCGNIHVTVTPCYQFTTRPSNLRTPFDPKDPKKNTQTAYKAQKESKPSEKDTTQTDKNQEATQKVSSNKPKETNVQVTSNKVTPVKVAEKVTPNSAKVTPKTTSSTTQNKPETKVVTSNVTVNKPESKATPVKVSDNKSEAKAPPMKVTANKTEVTPIKVVENKPQAKVNPVQSTEKNTLTKITPKVTAAKTTETKPVATANVNPVKPAENKPTPQAKTQVQSNQNTAKVIATKQPAVSQSKEIAKNQGIDKPNTAKVAPKTATVQKPATVAQTPASANQNASAKATPIKTDQTQTVNQKPVAKAAPTKTTQQNKPNTPIAKQNAVINKPAAKTVANKPKLTPTSAKQVKVTPKTPNKQSFAQKSKKESDFDELDDHDILALLSGGIVLDECSGSDVE